MKFLLQYSIYMVLFVLALHAQEPKMVLPVGHSGEKLTDIAFSANRKMIGTVSGNEIKIWEYNSGKLLTTIFGHQNGIFSMAFSADSKKMATTGFDMDSIRFSVKVWDIQSGKLLHTLANDSSWYLDAFFAKGDTSIICTMDSMVLVWNTANGHIERKTALTFGKQTRTLTDANRYISFASPAKVWDMDGKETTYASRPQLYYKKYNHLFANNRLLVSNGDTLGLLHLTQPLLSKQLILKKKSMEQLDLSKDGRYASIIHYPQTLSIWDTYANKLVVSMDSVESCQFNTAGNHYLVKRMGRPPEIRILQKGTKPVTIQRQNDPSYAAASCFFSPNYDKIIVARSNAFQQLVVDIWDVQTASFGNGLQGHTLPIEYATFNKLGNRLFTSSIRSLNQVYDMDYGKLIDRFYVKDEAAYQELAPGDTIIKGRQVYIDQGEQYAVSIVDTAQQTIFSIYPIDSTDYLTKIPQGYYQTTPHAAKMLHYVTKDFRVVSFEQLDIKYNRPDKVLEAIGCKDTALIRSYKKAYLKRIRKLGIDTAQFREGYSVPETDFMNREAIGYVQTSNRLSVKIRAQDSSYPLDRFNIWINEVPLFGLKGISVKNKNAKRFDTTCTIILSQGDNRIETSVTNANGTESYRMPLMVKYVPLVAKESKLHFIGVGINQFAHPGYNLNWSVKDITDLAAKLKSKYPGILIDTLFDAHVTKERVLALKQRLLRLNEDDRVIVAYSGHGLLSKDLDYYLSTYAINFEQPEEKGLAYDDLESLLDNIRPRQKLMLIDACHSGEVDKEEIAKIEAAKQSLDSMGTQSKSTVKVTPKKNLGMANSFELMQGLFLNVGKGTGATIISAAGGMQYAQERGDLKNGVFTYSIIEAFNNNPTLKVSELKKLVGTRVTQLTNGLQQPTSRNGTNNYDWVIW